MFSKQMANFPKIFLIIIAAAGLALLPALPTSISPGATPVYAKKKYKRAKRAPQSRKSDGPVLIVVSLGRQSITVYDRQGQIAQSRISSGTRGHRTPTGVFSVLQKRRRHYSNLYAGASMPNMQRITWSGVAMHAGHLPGYPASHGCIRLYYSFSKWLFGLTELGTRVIVSNASPKPNRIRHQALLKPLPPESAVELQSSSAENHDRAEAIEAPPNSLFVTPANAAEGPNGFDPKQIRTRESVAAERERELVKLETALENAKDTKLKAAADLNRANKVLKFAQSKLGTAQTEAEKLRNTANNSMKAQKSLNSQLRTLLKNSSTLIDPKKIEKAHANEERIESEILKHESEREMARKEAQDLAPIVEKLQANVDTAVHRRDQLKRSLNRATKQMTVAQLALNQAQAAAARRDKPITVLISRKKQMLYVRQGYDDVLRVAVDVKNPEMPIGTHVFAALAYTNNETELEWHAVTAARSDVSRRSKKRRRRSRRRRHQEVEYQPIRSTRRAQTPKNALNRIEIPQKVADRLAELIKPGSALIVSDEGLSNETGKYTDIIVSTR